MTTYDPDSLFGHGIRIEELENTNEALGDICRFMFEKAAINLENIEEVLRELWNRFFTHIDLGHKDLVMMGRDSIAKLDPYDKEPAMGINSYKTEKKDYVPADMADADELERRDSGGEKDCWDRCKTCETSACSECPDSKLPTIPLEPELEFGGKDVIKIPTDFDEKPPEYLFPANWRGNWNEPREDEPMERKDCLYWTLIHKCNYFNEALNTNNLNCQKCTAYKIEERLPDATGVEPREDDKLDKILDYLVNMTNRQHNIQRLIHNIEDKLK